MAATHDTPRTTTPVYNEANIIPALPDPLSGPHRQRRFTSRENWLVWRRTIIGASEVALITDLSRYGGQLTAYSRRHESMNDNDHLFWGRHLEAAIGEATAIMLGEGVRYESLELCPNQRTDITWMACSPDGLLHDPRVAAPTHLEIKNTSGRKRSDWPNTNGTIRTVGADCIIPMDPYCQAQWSMMVSGVDRWLVAVLIDGYDHRVYRVMADHDDQLLLYTAARAFWCDHVVPNVVPKPSRADNDPRKQLSALNPDLANEPVNLRELAAIADACLTAQKARKEASAAYDWLSGQLCHALAAHDSTIGEAGERSFTWKANRHGVRTFRIK